ncbi:AAA family ATPase [Intrasporangium calvum]|uniref:AAA family ATPase n=1 Tax=Intrasporangium calvum TaxID=53358 RepID=A0ABT5GDY4_9MICO|nr:AAA family ATPase [Intrasporangium calvum]MDC5696463.1 AAA family ATPase [Intrasporangium calvum]
MYCHAGCDTEDVLEALDLTKADLYDNPAGAHYEYVDGAGRPTRTVTRSADKRFSQTGGSHASELFRLPEVLSAVITGEVVYLVEGEKDVFALQALGVTATTAPMGASSFHRVDATPLSGARVVAVVDRDGAGDGWALQVRKKLREVGASVTFVRAAVGKDAADHVAAERGVEDFEPYEMGPAPMEDASSDDRGPSWAPMDLSAYLDGTFRAHEPTLLARSDGVSLLYRGLTHSLHGESESGKSMVMQSEAVRLLQAGELVLWLDFDSDPASVVERLRLLGATDEQMGAGFRYVHPEVSPHTDASEWAEWEALLTESYSLVVFDGVTDALVLLGYETINNDHIAAWNRTYPARLARETGAAVVMIDHVTKEGSTRGRFAIGGQTKMAGLTGAAYTVAVDKPLGRGLRGVIVLRVAKDRPGYVRGHSGAWRADRTQEAARVVVDSTGETVIVSVEPPQRRDDPTEFRPTTLMERISDVLEDEPLGLNAVNRSIRGKAEHVRRALKVLIDEGYVRVEDGPKGAHIHHRVRAYRQRDDEKSDQYQSGTH